MLPGFIRQQVIEVVQEKGSKKDQKTNRPVYGLLRKQKGFQYQPKPAKRNKKAAVQEKVGYFFQSLRWLRIKPVHISCLMPQSYKTILRFVYACSRLALLTGLLLVLTSGRQAQPPKAPAALQLLKHQAYHFSVPVGQTEAIWKFITNRYGARLPAPYTAQPAEQNVIDLYFDTKHYNLLRQNLVLRQRLTISPEGRHEFVQLLLPTGKTTQAEVIFKTNKKPDKGRNFTTHSLLKLIRSKDRSALDSLLKNYEIETETLRPVLEVTQQQKTLQMRRSGADWVMLSLAEVHSEAPEHQYTELRVQPDPELLTHATPSQQAALLKTADTLTQALRKNLPGLRQLDQNEYANMVKARRNAPVGFQYSKLIAGILVLGALLSYFIFRKNRKPEEAFTED